jgi:hypothetical protein
MSGVDFFGISRAIVAKEREAMLLRAFGTAFAQDAASGDWFAWLASDDGEVAARVDVEQRQLPVHQRDLFALAERTRALVVRRRLIVAAHYFSGGSD